MNFIQTAGATCIALICSALASPVLAGDLPTSKQAKKMLFKAGKKPTEVRFLREDLIPANMIPAFRMGASMQKYYESLAISPTEGLRAKSAFQAVNFHSAASADRAALAGCNAAKKKKSDDCVVIVQFVPKGYDGPRDFSLSALATADFSRKYRWARKNKAFAISPETGNWGRALKAKTLEAARAAAIAECSAMAGGAGDAGCVVVSEN
ncbi:MAG: 5-aminolevulic acid synthase [Paracoccaceae bacterium]